jgi:pimeloyl-ACP methyl ester carboxylesterase
MRDRPDRAHVLSSFNKPILFIGGAKDGGIPADSIRAQATLSAKAHVHILDDVAHMGMFEKPQETQSIVKVFLAAC